MRMRERWKMVTVAVAHLAATAPTATSIFTNHGILVTALQLEARIIGHHLHLGLVRYSMLLRLSSFRPATPNISARFNTDNFITTAPLLTGKMVTPHLFVH